jgi:tyrosyl-tRNA synthetase
MSERSVKKKMKEGNGVSLAEFCYPILQGWDWWMLRTRLGVQMQIGGSDQWGNIVTGMDVFKAARESEPDPAKRLPAESVYDDPVGFTVPLLTDSAGNKFGKSAGNAIWLDKFQTSTFDLYGFFVRRPDDEIEKLLKLFTFIPTPQIQQIMTEQAEDPGKRVAHHRLAYEVARLVHGEEEAERAQQQHKLMYGKGAAIMPPTPEAPAEGASSVLQTLVQSTGKPKGPTPITPNNAPRPDLKLPRSLIMTGSISKILYAAGLAESRKEGHRLALQQAAYIGGIPKGGPGAPMDPGMLTWLPVKLWAPEDTRRYLIDDKILLLRRGKHNIRIIEVISDEEYERLGLTYPGQPGTGRIRRLREQMKLLKEGKTTAEAVKKFMKEQLGMEKELAAFGAEAPEEESDDVFRLPERKSPYQLRLEMQLNEMVEKMEKEEEAAKKANRDEE